MDDTQNKNARGWRKEEGDIWGKSNGKSSGNTSQANKSILAMLVSVWFSHSELSS